MESASELWTFVAVILPVAIVVVLMVSRDRFKHVEKEDQDHVPDEHAR